MGQQAGKKKDPFYTGLKLKQLRTDKQFTQEQVAPDLGIKPNTLSNYENGTLVPPREVLEKAAVLFKIDVREFFTTDKFTFIFNNDQVAHGSIENNSIDSKEVFEWMREELKRRDAQLLLAHERVETLLRSTLEKLGRA